MSYFESAILDRMFLGNPAVAWVVAAIVFAAIVAILKVISSLSGKIIIKKGGEMASMAAGLIKILNWPLYAVIALYISLDVINTNALVQQWVFYAFLLVAVYYAVKVALGLIDFGVAKIAEKDGADMAKIKLLSNIIKTAVWAVAVILILSNFGYDVTSLLAGLGLGGLAVAMASQQILTDFIGAFIIYLDKPFKVGDRIMIGDLDGTVMKIGLRSVRMKAPTGEELIIPNKDAAGSRIKNLSKK